MSAHLPAFLRQLLCALGAPANRTLGRHGDCRALAQSTPKPVASFRMLQGRPLVWCWEDSSEGAGVALAVPSLQALGKAGGGQGSHTERRERPRGRGAGKASV